MIVDLSLSFTVSHCLVPSQRSLRGLPKSSILVQMHMPSAIWRFIFIFLNSNMVRGDNKKQPTRGQQPYTSGLGKVFTTPTKRRNKHKSTTLVAPIGLDMRRKHLLNNIRRLKAFSSNAGPKTHSDATATLEGRSSEDDPALEFGFHDNDNLNTSLEPISNVPFGFNGGDVGNDLDPILPTKPRRTLPNATAHELYNCWIARLPTLVSSLSLYVTRTTGVPLEPITELKSTCSTDRKGRCNRRTSTILGLFYDRMFIYFYSIYIYLSSIC